MRGFLNLSSRNVSRRWKYFFRKISPRESVRDNQVSLFSPNFLFQVTSNTHLSDHLLMRWKTRDDFNDIFGQYYRKLVSLAFGACSGFTFRWQYDIVTSTVVQRKKASTRERSRMDNYYTSLDSSRHTSCIHCRSKEAKCRCHFAKYAEYEILFKIKYLECLRYPSYFFNFIVSYKFIIVW